MKAHFGDWLKKVRERLGLTQSELAALVGLDTYMTVRLWERSAEPKMRGIPREGLLSVLGLEDEVELNSLWQTGTMPDIEALRRRVVKLQSLHRQLTISVRREIYEVLEARAKERGVPVEREAEELLSNWVMNYRDFHRLVGEAIEVLDKGVGTPGRPRVSEHGQPGDGPKKSAPPEGPFSIEGNGEKGHGGSPR